MRLKRNKLEFMLIVAALLAGSALAQDWTSRADGIFTVRTASAADAEVVPRVLDILQQARRDLRGYPAAALPHRVTVVIHPTLASFTGATGQPWYVAAIANRDEAQIDTQRLQVLLARNLLKPTLRHELFHLAQPADWPRWLAEGAAMLFAGERPQASPLPNLSDADLNALLADPPSQEMLTRAEATAYERARRELPEVREKGAG